MSKVNCKLTVFFEEPFWVGVYERWEDSRYSACKITFGAEPKDAEVWELLLDSFHRFHFSPSLAAAGPEDRRINPKRVQRMVRREMQNTGTGTKAQEALKLQHEEGKERRKKHTRQQKEQEQERQFQLRKQKQKARHKGH